MSGMTIAFHGGMCCGIKHIYSMGNAPSALQWAQQVRKTSDNSDVTYNYRTQETNFYHNADGTIPQETGEQRLDRYLDFLREKRPCHIVEITLVTGPSACPDQSTWVPCIVERGFVEVTPDGGVYNSNSGNRVRVFHLYLTNKEVKDEDDD